MSFIHPNTNTVPFYHKHAATAFREGYYERLKVKRHYQTKYDRYHYWLPAKLSPVISFLKEYFQALDAWCKTPPEHRYRQTEFEYAETAIITMHHIRNRIGVLHPILAGSQKICPCPWALFGPSLGNIQNRLIQHRFPTIQDILRHYDSAVWGRGFNIATIDRPLNMQADDDRLDLLANLYDKSANYILSIALLLITDLIQNCGPDCGELHILFTNDRRMHNDDFSSWEIVRQNIVEPFRNNFIGSWAKATSRHYYSSQRSLITSKYQCVKTYKNTYWEVDVKDATLSSNADLADGETVEYFGECQVKSPVLLLPPPDDYKQLSLVDLTNDDDVVEKLERKLDLPETPIFGIFKPTDFPDGSQKWQEETRGWHGLED